MWNLGVLGTHTPVGAQTRASIPETQGSGDCDLCVGTPIATLPSHPQSPHPQNMDYYRETSVQGCEFVWQLLLSS